MTLNTIPHKSSNTRCHINISLRHFVYNTNKPKLQESCSTKSKPYSMLQIKTFIVVLLKKSFEIHLCCLKNIVLEKLTISRNAIDLLNCYIQNFFTLTKKLFPWKHFQFSSVTRISSSSCRAASTDIPDPLSPLLPIIHRLRQVFRVTSCVLTLLLYVSSSWSSCFCTAICGGP